MYRHLPPSAFRNPPTAQGLLEVPEVHLLDRQFHGCINTPENLEELDRMDWDLTLKAGHPFKWQHLLTTKLRMFPCQAYEKNEELDWDIVKYSAARLAAIAVETVLMKEHTRARQTAVDNGGRNQAPVLQGNRQRSSYQSMRDHQPTIQELKEQAFNKAEDVFLTVLRDLFSFKVTRRPDGTETAFRSFTVGEVANFPIRLSILFQVQNMVRLFRNGFASLPHEQQSRVLHGEELQLPMEPEEMMRIPHPLGAEDLERRRKRQIRTEEEIEEGLHESWEEPAAERREYVRLVRFAFALARQAKIYNPSEDVHDYERIYQTEVLMDDAVGVESVAPFRHKDADLWAQKFFDSSGGMKERHLATKAHPEIEARPETDADPETEAHPETGAYTEAKAHRVMEAHQARAIHPSTESRTAAKRHQADEALPVPTPKEKWT